MNGFFAIVVPTGTPTDVVTRLNKNIGEYLRKPEMEERLLPLGLATEGGGTPESTAQVIHQEQELWRRVAKELDVQPQ